MAAVDYGRDISCTDDIAADFHVSSGRRLLCEAIARRLITRKGALRRHKLYGYDVRDEINNDLGPGDLERISSGVREQCMRDTRVLQATCACTLEPDGTLTLSIILVDGIGPFPLVLSASDVTVQIVSNP